MIDLYVRDLNGNEYAAMCTTLDDIDLNGDHIIDVVVENNSVNRAFIEDIDKLWEFVDNDGIEFKIIYIDKKGVGNKPVITFKAHPLFFDYMNTHRIYEEYNGSMTFQRACELLFEDTPFNFVVGGVFNAVSWEGFGAGEARLETFKRILNRYGAEFKFVGNNVHFQPLVGEDTNILYAHKLNASDIELNIDATEYYTYAKGFGDYSDEDGVQAANLKREYTSPLASVLGKRHAPPIMDGRVKVVETMDKNLKTLVDESLKISITANMYMFAKQGYSEYIPNVGDRVFMSDRRIGLNEEVRIVNLKIKRNWKGDIIDFQAMLGTQDVVKRQQSKLNTAVNQITDIFEGKTKLPFNVLDNAVIHATKLLQNAESELLFPETGGILAVDKNNPNLVVLLNSAGVGISKDGGRTFKNAITGEGIVAEAVLAGVVEGLIINGGEINGGKFTTTGGDDRVEIKNGVMQTYRNGNLTSQVNGRYHSFYRDDRTVGHIGADSWTGDPSYRGLVVYADDADYFGWGVKNNQTGKFDLVFSWHKNDEKANAGLNLNVPSFVTSNSFNVGGRLQMRSTSNGFRIGLDVGSNGTYIYMNDNGQVGFVNNGDIFKSFAP